jgi:hypothetical protein
MRFMIRLPTIDGPVLASSLSVVNAMKQPYLHGHNVVHWLEEK